MNTYMARGYTAKNNFLVLRKNLKQEHFLGSHVRKLFFLKIIVSKIKKRISKYFLVYPRKFSYLRNVFLE